MTHRNDPYEHDRTSVVLRPSDLPYRTGSGPIPARYSGPATPAAPQQTVVVHHHHGLNPRAFTAHHAAVVKVVACALVAIVASICLLFAYQAHEQASVEKERAKQAALAEKYRNQTANEGRAQGAMAGSGVAVVVAVGMAVYVLNRRRS